MLNTGIRASELLDLELDDVQVDGAKARLIIRHGKGGKYREIPLAPQVLSHLRNYLKVRPDASEANIFLGKRGPLRTTDALNKILKKYGRRVGIEKKIHPHLLRHQFATELLRNKGADIVLVSEILGHENLNTTMIYTRPTAEEKERALTGLYQQL